MRKFRRFGAFAMTLLMLVTAVGNVNASELTQGGTTESTEAVATTESTEAETTTESTEAETTTESTEAETTTESTEAETTTESTEAETTTESTEAETTTESTEAVTTTENTEAGTTEEQTTEDELLGASTTSFSKTTEEMDALLKKNVSFDNWVLTYDLLEIGDEEVYLAYELYCDGKIVGDEKTLNVAPGKGTDTVNLSGYADESGTYTLKVRYAIFEESEDEDGRVYLTSVSSTIEVGSTSYTRPSQTLGTTEVSWVEGADTPTIQFARVEGAKSYKISYYFYDLSWYSDEICYDVSDDGRLNWYGMEYDTWSYDETTGIYTCDFSPFVSSPFPSGTQYVSVTVKALSGSDYATIASGEASKASAIYDLKNKKTIATEDLNDYAEVEYLLATATSPKEARELIYSWLGVSTAKGVLEAKAASYNLTEAEIEANLKAYYATYMPLMVEQDYYYDTYGEYDFPASMDSYAKEAFADVTGYSGVIWNADSYSDKISLQISEPESEVEIDAEYKDCTVIPFDVDLLINGQSMHELKYPLTVSVTLPSDMLTIRAYSEYDEETGEYCTYYSSNEEYILLHVLPDGTAEKVSKGYFGAYDWEDDGAWDTISSIDFTVTSLSTFVLVLKDVDTTTAANNTTTTTTTSTDSPKTGDTAPIAWLGGISMASMLGLTFMVSRRRKEEDNR